MTTVSQIAMEIVGREGDYVNDPDDPGGPTKYGVTIGTMRRLGLDLDQDGDVDAEDVKLLSVDKAIDIFIEHYFYKPRIAELPAPLHATVFDMQVNAGGNAVKILQNLLNKMGFDSGPADGVIGKKTINAANAAHIAAPAHIADAYGIERRNYYFRLADGRPAFRKYCITRSGGKGGWIRRAEEFISPKYHMTADEFIERTEPWLA